MATLADIRARVLDAVDHSGTSYHVANRVRDYINDGLSRLHDILINTFDDYSRATQSISLVSGTETYALPATYYKTIKVFYLNGGRRFAVSRFSLENIEGYKVGPLNAGSVEHWHTTCFVPLSGESDAVDANIQPGWEDYAAMHAAGRLMIRERQDPTPFFTERDRIGSMIEAMAATRTQEAIGISDVSRRWEVNQYAYERDRVYMYRVMGQYIHFVELEYTGV